MLISILEYFLSSILSISASAYRYISLILLYLSYLLNILTRLFILISVLE